MSQSSNKQAQNTQQEQPEEGAMSGFIRAAGAILAISYPVLALSTGVRAIYQIIEGDPANAPWITLIAAILYTIAAIGFLKQPRPQVEKKKGQSKFFLKRWWDEITPQQAWRVSMVVLTFETIMALLVGLLSYISPGLIGRNVWTHFGADYGYFPIIQPLLGLAWLLHPKTMQIYGIRARKK